MQKNGANIPRMRNFEVDSARKLLGLPFPNLLFLQLVQEQNSLRQNQCKVYSKSKDAYRTDRSWSFKKISPIVSESELLLAFLQPRNFYYDIPPNLQPLCQKRQDLTTERTLTDN